MTFPTTHIRNIVLCGQKGTGKTSLAEAILFSAKAVTRLGRVEDHNTTLDYEPEEHKRVASVQSAVAHCEWHKHKVNVIDTPGDPTFYADARYMLPAAEAVGIVVSAADPVEPHSVKLSRNAAEQGQARFVVVNKCCHERANFSQTVEAARARLASTAVALTLPFGEGGTVGVIGVIDLMKGKAFVYKPGSNTAPTASEVPAALADEVALARSALCEEIAGSDEALMEKFLEAGELSETELKDGLRRAITSGALCPVFAVDATSNVGVATFLDILVDSFPGPLEGSGFTIKTGDKEEAVAVNADESKAFLAWVFKTVVDQQSGKLSILKVLRGKATKDTAVENINHRASERFGTLLAVQGKKTEAATEAHTGDIIAVAKLKDTLTGDTLGATRDSPTVVLKPFPPTQISFRVWPKNKGDEDKISQALHRIRDEDPTLVLGLDDVTRELVVSGYGVAHIDTALEKMERKFGVQVEKAPPMVAYRETLMKAVHNVEGKHKKQSGGRGQFGVCYINVKPRARGDGYLFTNSIFGGAIPRQWIAPVDKGVQEAMARGVLAGYPVVDVEIELYDGKYHDVDSSEMAFKIAGSKAFQEAVKKGGGTILEPVMHVEIEVPEESMGDVMGDINSRRGRIQGMDTLNGVSTIKAQVPQAEMLMYASDLKSMTQGLGSFVMTPSHYDPVPSHLVDKIIADSPKKPSASEDDA